MQKFKLTSQLYTLLFVCLALCAMACSEDDRGRDPMVPAQSEVTISLDLPVPVEPATRAISETNQNKVDHVVLLLFEASGHYTYHTYVPSPTMETSNNTTTVSFSASLPIGSNYKMMILANAKELFEASYGPYGQNLTMSTTRDQVLNTLKASKTDTWTASLPMWSETTGISIPSGGNVTAKPLVRMHAAINVEVASGVSFTLGSIRIYNYSGNGALIPSDDVWNSADNKVTNPTSPNSVGYAKTTGPISKSISGKPKTYQNELFLFEAPAGSTSTAGTASTLPSHFYMIIGGYYNGSTTETYYRVDLATSNNDPISQTLTYMPLLRNHKYTITFTTVRSQGYATVADAQKAAPFTGYRVTPASGDMVEMLWNDDTYLAISRKSINLGYGQYPFTETLAAHGVSITHEEQIVIESNASITVTGNTFSSLSLKSTSGTRKTYNVTSSPNNGTGTRTGTITISTADRLLSTTISMTQANDSQTTVQLFDGATEVSDNKEFIFMGASTSTPASKTLRVRYPMTADGIEASTTASKVADSYCQHGFDVAQTITKMNRTSGWGNIVKILAPVQPSTNAPWKSGGIAMLSQRSTKYVFKSGTKTKTIYARQLVPHARPTTTATDLLPALHSTIDGWVAPTTTWLANCPLRTTINTATATKGTEWGSHNEGNFLSTAVTITAPSGSQLSDYRTTQVTVNHTIATAVTRQTAVKYNDAVVPFTLTSDISGFSSYTKRLKAGKVNQARENPNYNYSLVDTEGNVYPTSKIGDKIWMIDNYKGDEDDYAKSVLTLKVKPAGSSLPATRLVQICYLTESSETCPDGWTLPTIQEMKNAYTAAAGDVKAFFKPDGTKSLEQCSRFPGIVCRCDICGRGISVGMGMHLVLATKNGGQDATCYPMSSTDETWDWFRTGNPSTLRSSAGPTESWRWTYTALALGFYSYVPMNTTLLRHGLNPLVDPRLTHWEDLARKWNDTRTTSESISRNDEGQLNKSNALCSDWSGWETAIKEQLRLWGGLDNWNIRPRPDWLDCWGGEREFPTEWGVARFGGQNTLMGVVRCVK